MRAYKFPRLRTTSVFRHDVLSSLSTYAFRALSDGEVALDEAALTALLDAALSPHVRSSYDFDGRRPSSKERAVMVLDLDADPLIAACVSFVLDNFVPDYFSALQTARAATVTPFDLIPLLGRSRTDQAAALGVCVRTVSSLRAQYAAMLADPARAAHWRKVVALKARMARFRARRIRRDRIKAAIQRKIAPYLKTKVVTLFDWLPGGATGGSVTEAMTEAMWADVLAWPLPPPPPPPPPPPDYSHLLYLLDGIGVGAGVGAA